MKIVHLSNDEKFLPLMRSLFEEAFPGQNRYLLPRARPGDRRYVVPAPDIVRWPSWRFRNRWLPGDLADADVVVVHLMSSRFAQVLRRLRPNCLVVWLAGGGDYMDLLVPRLGSLWLPRTARLLGALNAARADRSRSAWRRLLSVLRARREPSAAARPKPPPVVSVAPRIDVFSANEVDARLLRGALPPLRATLHTIPWFTVEDTFSAGMQPMAGSDVLLGHSASPANNHLDTLALLRGRLPPDSRVVAPLSYGSGPAGYAEAVAEAGRAALGERFEALTGWLPIEAYNARIARCGWVLMNQRRQQAVGNICAALYRGATVYMRRDNPLYEFLGTLGIELPAIEDLETDAAAPLITLTPEQQQRNRAAVVARYGRDRVVARIRALQGLRR